MASTLVREPDTSRPLLAAPDVVIEIEARLLKCDVCRSRAATCEDSERPALLCWACFKRHAR